MATPVRNSDTLAELRKAAQVQLAADGFPSSLSSQIVPVIEINPSLVRTANFLRDNNQSTTGTMTVFTSASDRDTYLQSVSLSFAKDATCDIATGTLHCTAIVDGATRKIIGHGVLTLTADARTSTISFPKPLKIDRNTAVQVNGSFTVGALSRQAIVTGFTAENITGQ